MTLFDGLRGWWRAIEDEDYGAPGNSLERALERAEALRSLVPADLYADSPIYRAMVQEWRYDPLRPVERA